MNQEGKVVSRARRRAGGKGVLPEIALRVRDLVHDLLRQLPFQSHGGITRLGEALKISQSAARTILAGGGISLETAYGVAALARVDSGALLGDGTSSMKKGRRFPQLEVCLAYHGSRRWADATIAAARAGLRADDTSPESWTGRLEATHLSLAGSASSDR